MEVLLSWAMRSPANGADQWHGRMRIGRFDVTIRLADVAADISHLRRCLQQFEEFCVVTESVRNGIPVAVRVVDGAGREVFADGQVREGA